MNDCATPGGQHEAWVEGSPDIIVVHDGDRVLYVNRRGWQTFGAKDAASMVGRRIGEFLPAEAADSIRGRVRRMLETGETAPTLELPILLADGTTIAGELRSAPVPYQGGRAIQTVIRDVSRRRAAEDALTDTRARFEGLFDSVPIGLYRSTVGGEFLSVNRALVEMLGYPDAQTLMSVHTPHLYADPAERRRWIQRAERDGIVEDVDVQLLRSDGSVVPARLSTRAHLGMDGAPEYFEGAVQDLSASRRAEERYRLLFETTAQGVIYQDPDGVVVEANPAAEWILGLTEAELSGRASADPRWMTTRRDGTPLAAQDHPSMRALKERTPVRGELMGVCNPRRDERRWIEVESIPLFRPGEGDPYQVYSTFSDVTDRIRAEEELRRSEQRLERALAGSGLGLWDWDIQSGGVYVDDRWYLTLGYEPGEFALKFDHWLTLLHPDDRDRAEAALADHLSGRTSFYQCELRIRTKGGDWKWILDRGHVVESDETGRALRAAGTHTDIHERKAAEDALRRSEERLATIFRAAPVGITLSRVRDGTLLEVNDTFARALGYRPAELVGRSSLEVGLWVDPEERVRVTEELLRTGRLEGATVHFTTSDGEAREMQLFAELITVDEEPCALTLHRDQTDARRLEEQLRQAQKMEAVGRLAGGIAHDFNNVLTAITGHARFLMESLPPGDDRRADAEQIDSSADRARRLTRQLLAFSRQQVLRPRVVELGRVLSSFEPLLARLLGEDVVLAVRTEGEDARVKVDPSQLEQVVLNLALNARDAMPGGGQLEIVSGSVRLDDAGAPGDVTVPAGRYARLTVRDTGAGMNAATRARLFEPFYTTKPPGKGTGLGLSTVYGIVSQSEGYITVRSAPERGTTFDIYLPVARGEPELEPAVEREAGDTDGDETILLVEDEETVRSLAVRVLERAGYAVHSASDGTEALRVAEAVGPFDLVVTDVIMPEMGGRELAERLRERQPDLRVVLMSGYTGDEALGATGRSNGAFLEKPFTPVQLAATVRAAIDR